MIYLEIKGIYIIVTSLNVVIRLKPADPKMTLLSLALSWFFDHQSLLFSLSPLILVSFAWILYKSTKPRNSKPLPGPRGLPFVGNLPFLDPNLHTYFADLATTYGPIFKLRLGSNLVVVITSPALAKQVLKDHDTTFANRNVNELARITSFKGSDIVWNPYGPEWRMLRKLCVREMLSSMSLDAIHELHKREVRRMVRVIHGSVGSPVNVGEELSFTISSIILSMMWGGGGGGRDVGDGDDVGDRRIERLGMECRRLVCEMMEVLSKPNVSDVFKWLERFDLQGIKRTVTELMARIERIFDTVIEERLRLMDGGGGKEMTKDFLQILLQLKEEGGEGKTSFTMNHLKALLLDMMIGGTDTTSNTVEWAIAELMNKPETMKKAQEELERVVGKDNILEESHFPKLHYLQVVMKEVLRLHPPIPLLIPHSPSSSCNIGGYMIPKGTGVFVNTWAMHRDSLVWENPLEFRPERFFDSKWDYTGIDFNYFPFGSGRRICAGKTMAERMFIFDLGTLLHSFDWELPEGSKLDLNEKFGMHGCCHITCGRGFANVEQCDVSNVYQ
ncbi:hypothetical protein Sjap_020511 [Stephania japonica]|uniref:Cytochrome P450 n=1 Tax=Stephania japonica TaxID=461633 RepID=A0AAP0HZ25_9MAGN